MTVYYTLLIGSLALGAPLCENRNKTHIKIYLGVVFLAFFVIAAIRKISGYDYNLYAGWYNELIFKNYSWITSWSREKGFTVPLKILSVVTLDYRVMFAVIAFIIAAGVTAYIYKFSGRAYVSVAAFIMTGLYYNSLNFMRQFIAAIIVSYAFYYVYTKQPLRFYVLVLFASCFHFSALLLIPFYFILRIKPNYKTLAVYCAIAAVTFIYSVPIMELATEYFYKSYDPLTSSHMLLGLPESYTLVFGALFVLFFILRKDLADRYAFNSVLINAYFFAVYFMFIGIKHSIIARFAMLFLVAPIIVLIPASISVINEKLSRKFKSRAKAIKILTAVGFCLYGLTFHAILLVNNYNGVLPYMTIFGD